MSAIPAIITACKEHFLNSQFALERVTPTYYEISGNDLASALNDRRGEIKVLHWFDNFWVYMEINLPFNEKGEQTPSISISIFQGEAADLKKEQLFRAEWDSFENNIEHPQPHWHIYAVKPINDKIYEDYQAYLDLKMEQEAGFETFQQQELNKLFPIQKIHFAMNAQWATGKGHIHSLSEKDAMINWIQGILQHIKSQLEYVSK